MWGFQAEGAAPIVRGDRVAGAGDGRDGDPDRRPGVLGRCRGGARRVRRPDRGGHRPRRSSPRSGCCRPRRACSSSRRQRRRRSPGCCSATRSGLLDPGQLVVCTVTGNGLKDTETALRDDQHRHRRPSPADVGAAARRCSAWHAGASQPASVTVRVPATSANLGPGFDCLGLALDLHDEVAVECRRPGRRRPGQRARCTARGPARCPPTTGTWWCGRARGPRRAGRAAPGRWRCTCTNRIPHGRGLGSSAAPSSPGCSPGARWSDGGADRLDDDAVLSPRERVRGPPGQRRGLPARRPDPRLGATPSGVHAVRLEPASGAARRRCWSRTPSCPPRRPAGCCRPPSRTPTRRTPPAGRRCWSRPSPAYPACCCPRPRTGCTSPTGHRRCPAPTRWCGGCAPRPGRGGVRCRPHRPGAGRARRTGRWRCRRVGGVSSSTSSATGATVITDLTRRVLRGRERDRRRWCYAQQRTRSHCVAGAPPRLPGRLPRLSLRQPWLPTDRLPVVHGAGNQWSLRGSRGALGLRNLVSDPTPMTSRPAGRSNRPEPPRRGPSPQEGPICVRHHRPPRRARQGQRRRRLRRLLGDQARPQALRRPVRHGARRAAGPGRRARHQRHRQDAQGPADRGHQGAPGQRLRTAADRQGTRRAQPPRVRGPAPSAGRPTATTASENRPTETDDSVPADSASRPRAAGGRAVTGPSAATGRPPRASPATRATSRPAASRATASSRGRQQDDRQGSQGGDRKRDDRGGQQGNRQQGGQAPAAARPQGGQGAARPTATTRTTSTAGRPQPPPWPLPRPQPQPPRRPGRLRPERRRRLPEISEDDVLVPVAGILDILDNYAFVRTSGYLPGPNDVYVVARPGAQERPAQGRRHHRRRPAAARGRAQGEVQRARPARHRQRRRAGQGRGTGSSSASSRRSTRRTGCASRPSPAS